MARLVQGAAVVAALASPAVGADSEGRFSVNYPGTMACNVLVAAEPDSRETFAVAAFAEGWMAAHAKLMPDVFDLTPWQSTEYVVGQVRAFCGANPDAAVVTALDQLAAFLRPDALREGAAPQTVTNGEQMVLLHPETLERVRNALVERGFAEANGGDPVAGLAEFQRSQGLPASGLPDQRTLQRLFSR